MAATCTASGIIVERCSGCGETRTSTIPAQGHRMGKTEVELVAATCETAGRKGYECANCDYEEVTRTTEPLTHDLQLDSTKDATSGHDGEKVYRCGRLDCNYTKTEPIHYLSGNWEFGLKDENEKWTRGSYACRLGEAPSDNLYIVQFCSACEKHVEELQVAATMQTKVWSDELQGVTVTHIGNQKPVHLYTTSIDENGEVVEWCVECEYCYSCKEYLNVNVQPLSPSQTGREDTRYCPKCQSDVSVSYDEGKQYVNWCELFEHSLVYDEENSRAATPEADGEEVWKCSVEGCDYHTEPTVLHYPEAQWQLVVLSGESYEAGWHDCSEELPEYHYAVKYCEACRSRGEDVIAEEKPADSCRYVEETEEPPEIGGTEMLHHVCPDGLMHYYRTVGEGDEAVTYCIATRYCICCNRMVGTLEPHSLRLLENGKGDCDECRMVAVTEEIGGDFILNEQWCEIFKENHPWIVDEYNTNPPTEDMCGRNVWYCGFNGGEEKVEEVHILPIGYGEIMVERITESGEPLWSAEQYNCQEGIESLDGTNVVRLCACGQYIMPGYDINDCLVTETTENGTITHVCIPDSVLVFREKEVDGETVVMVAECRIYICCGRVVDVKKHNDGGTAIYNENNYLYTCSECNTSMIQDEGGYYAILTDSEWCELYGHNWELNSSGAEYSYYCDRGCVFRHCVTCHIQEEVVLSDDNFEEYTVNLEDYEIEMLQTRQFHVYEYVLGGGEFSEMLYLSTEDEMTFSEEELMTATLYERCTNSVASELYPNDPKNCSHSEEYTGAALMAFFSPAKSADNGEVIEGMYVFTGGAN